MPALAFIAAVVLLDVLVVSTATAASRPADWFGPYGRVSDVPLDSGWYAIKASELSVSGEALTRGGGDLPFESPAEAAAPATATAGDESDASLLSIHHKTVKSSAARRRKRQDRQSMRGNPAFHRRQTLALQKARAAPPRGWMPAAVPGTVLTTLIANRVYSDPYFEDAVLDIPDVSTAGADFYTYWFYNNFTLPVPPSGVTAPVYTLQLRGIAYSVDVYLNGQLIPPLVFSDSPPRAEGFFCRFQYDLTPAVSSGGGTQALAVLVHPPPVSGVPTPNEQGGDHTFPRNGPVPQFLLGWDWASFTPDRNTGLWDRVSVSATGCLVIDGPPHVVTTLPNVLSVTAEVSNRCAEPVTGVIRATVTDTSQSIQTDAITFPANTLRQVVNFPHSILIANVRLWWPNGSGAQPLYTLDVTATTTDNAVSDSYRTEFGVRTVSTFIDPHSGGRVFTVNSQPIFIRGGNWIATDQMFRYATSLDRYYQEVHAHAEMGLNLIRVWGGGLTERTEFYRVCDREGILVMQEFWMTGDNNGRWAGSYDYPDDHALYIATARDVVRQLRSHASLLFWCDGNELSPPAQNPPPDITSALQDAITELDGTRLLIQSSMNSYGSAQALAPADGPYGIRSLTDFWLEDPGLTSRVPFQPETGSISVPTADSMRQFMNESTLEQFPGPGAGSDELGVAGVDPIWTFHKWIGMSSDNGAGVDQLYNYGTPATIDDFCFTAQIVGWQQYKALMEGHHSHMWDWYTAVIIWKTQSPWPALRGFMMDWYGQQTGSYYGLRRALAQPLHIQLNQPATGSESYNFSVSIINTAIVDAHDLHARLEWRTLRGDVVSSSEWDVKSVQANSVLTFPDQIPYPDAAAADGTLLFACLELRDDTRDTNFRKFKRLNLYKPNNEPQSSSAAATGAAPARTMLSSNVDWLSPPDAPTNYSALGSLRYGADMQPIALVADATVRTEHNSLEFTVRFGVDASAPALAFAVQLQLLKAPFVNPTTDRLLPVWYSDNYLHAFPGDEPRTIRIRCDCYVCDCQTPDSARVQVTGWNTVPVVLISKPEL